MADHKILCVCEGGNNRSVCLDFFLKTNYGLDALSMGIRFNANETKDMLYRWADAIILLDASIEPLVPVEYADKVMVWDVGPDRYGVWWHQDLQAQLKTYCRDRIGEA